MLQPPTFLRIRYNLPRRQDQRPVVLRVAGAGGFPQRFPYTIIHSAKVVDARDNCFHALQAFISKTLVRHVHDPPPPYREIVSASANIFGNYG